jgi:flagellin FlaB
MFNKRGSSSDKARRQRGITGLETAIVLIAFVVVASVFAFTILSAGVFASEANKQTIHAGLKETRTRMRQNGSAFAFAGRQATNDAVFKITFIVSNSLAGEPVDLTPPYTADDSNLDPDVDAAASPSTILAYADENQRFLDVPWTVKFIGNNNGDFLMEDGEKAEITVWLMDRDYDVADVTATDSVAYMNASTADGGGVGAVTATDTIIAKSTRFVIEMSPQIGASLAVSRTLPPGLRTVMNLN